MSQQGWPRNPRSGQQDDWWSQLYDPGSPDTGSSQTGDTLDDRYASVRRTMGPGTATGRGPAAPEAPGTGGAGEGPGAGRGSGRTVREPEPGGGAAEPDGDAGATDNAEPGGETDAVPDSARDTGRDTARDTAREEREGRTATPERPVEPARAEASGRAEGSVTSEAPGTTAPHGPGPGPGSAPGPWPADEPYADRRTGGPVPRRPTPERPVDQPPADQPPAGPAPQATAEPQAGPLPDAGAADLAQDPAGPSGPEAARAGGTPREGESGEPEAPVPQAESGGVPRRPDHVGDRPPTYEAEPGTFPAADAASLSELVPDTVLDGAHYGGLTLRAASLRGDSARHRGVLRRDALLTARFGSGESALLFVAVAAGGRAASGGHRAAREICHSMGSVVGRSHDRLAEDIRAGRRGELKSGLQRLTDRCYNKLRAQAAALGMRPEEYTADLRCLLLSADPRCRTRVFFGSGEGGLFRLRSGVWQDAELDPDERKSGPEDPRDGDYGAAPGTGSRADPEGPLDSVLDALDPSELGDPAALSVPLSRGGPKVPRTGLSGGDPRSAGPARQRPRQSAAAEGHAPVPGATGAAGRAAPQTPAPQPPAPQTQAPEDGQPLPPVPPPVRPEPQRFRFCAVTGRRGDAFLLCSPGLARPLRAEPALATRLARSWTLSPERPEPPGLAAFLADVQLRVRGYADDRTAVAVWEG